jgi:hypothetical protein
MNDEVKIEKNIWRQFQGKENTNDVLSEKAMALSTPLVLVAKENTNELLSEIGKQSNIKFKDDFGGELVLEMTFFFLHIIDRVAYKYIGPEKRSIFISTLLAEVLRCYSNPYPGKTAPEGYSDMIMSMYNERQKEYWKHEKWFPEEKEGTKDTLFWEFAKNFTDICRLNMNVAVMMTIQSYTFSSIKAFNLPGLFRSVDSAI